MAIKFYESALEVKYSRSLLLRLKDACKGKGDCKVLSKGCKVRIEKDPNDMTAWFELGEMYIESGNFEEGIRAYEKVLDNETNLSALALFPYHSLFDAYIRKGDYEGVSKAYERSIKNPKDVPTRLVELVQAYVSNGDFDRAINASEIEINRRREFPWIWAEIGNVYAMKLDYSSALEAYQRSLKLDHLYFDGWYSLVETYRKMGDTDKTHQTLQSLRCLLTEKKISSGFLSDPSRSTISSSQSVR